MKHLNNPSSYQFLTSNEARLAADEIKSAIRSRIIDYHPFIGNMAAKYIRTNMNDNKDPFGFVYLLYKQHKSPISTRPVCSDCGNVLHSLGRWVMLKLQPIAKKTIILSRHLCTPQIA